MGGRVGAGGRRGDADAGELLHVERATHTVARTAHGWKAHVEVPLTSLPWMRTEFRANFCRNRIIKGLTEFSMTSKYAKGYQHFEKYGWIIIK